MELSGEMFKALFEAAQKRAADRVTVITHTIGDKKFECVFDKDYIVDSIKGCRARFEEGVFLPYTGLAKNGFLSEKEFNENVDKLLKSFNEMITQEKVIEFIESAQKKKNGTFYRNRYVHKEFSENAEFFREDYCAWERAAITVQAIDDYTLRLAFGYIKDLPKKKTKPE